MGQAISSTVKAQNVAIQQSPLYGGSKGNRFNDLEAVVGFPATLSIDVVRPIKSITILYGSVVDGIETVYIRDDGQTTRVGHGTSSSNTGLQKGVVTVGEHEKIIAVSGITGEDVWGDRVAQLSFVLYNSTSGQVRVEGPFGGGRTSAPKPFHVAADGRIAALGGYAVDTDSALGQLKEGQNGGLYGLTFFGASYRPDL